jgi:hypothetical protein
MSINYSAIGFLGIIIICALFLSQMGFSEGFQEGATVDTGNIDPDAKMIKIIKESKKVFDVEWEKLTSPEKKIIKAYAQDITDKLGI